MFANAPAQTQGIFKRGMKGVYQHCGEQHLHRYLAEFEFRYNHRSTLEFAGKRLTYQHSCMF